MGGRMVRGAAYLALAAVIGLTSCATLLRAQPPVEATR